MRNGWGGFTHFEHFACNRRQTPIHFSAGGSTSILASEKEQLLLRNKSKPLI